MCQKMEPKLAEMRRCWDSLRREKGVPEEILRFLGAEKPETRATIACLISPSASKATSTTGSIWGC